MPALAQRLRSPVLAAGGLLAAVAAVAVRDPHRHGSWGFCPFLLLTGHPCPFCGGLRAVNDLTHGDLRAALDSNALVVLALPLAVWLLALWAVRRARGRGDEPFPGVGARGTAAAVALVACFWFLRLLPALAWLTPAPLLAR